MIKKIWRWLCTHKDLAHLIGGFGIGLALGVPAAVAAAVTSEVKDIQWGGSATINDAVLTIAGGIVGGIIHYYILKIII